MKGREREAMNIGAKLKETRAAAGLTQEQAAEAIGVSRQTLSHWENEKTYPDILSVIALSDAYGVSLDALLKEGTASPGYRAYLRKSTDAALSRRRVGEVMVTAVLLLVWAAGLIEFWAFLDPSQALGYGLVFLWVVYPLTAFVLSVVAGVQDYWGRAKWGMPLVLGVLYAAVPYLTFDLANWLEFQGSLGAPSLFAVMVGALISLLGMTLGVGMSWLKEAAIERMRRN